MIPDAEQAMVQSHLEPMVLPASRYRAGSLIRRIRIRDTAPPTDRGRIRLWRVGPSDHVAER